MARIPKNPRFNCYFGCDEGGPLHHFPKPHIDLERFDIWKAVLDTETKSKGNEYIYNQLRLCDKHFENYYKSPSRILTRNAVPTLYVKDGTFASPHVEMTPSVSTELSSASAPGTASLLPKVVTVRPVVLRKPLKIKLNTGTFASPQVKMTPSVSTELSSLSAPGTASLMPKVVSVPLVLKHPLKRKLNTGTFASPQVEMTLSVSTELSSMSAPGTGIPKNPRFNCYFGCNEGGPLHHFPKPHTDLERFDIWKAVLDTETKSKGNEYIYNQLRLCDKHFENYYKSPSRILTRNAVPTLCVKDGTFASPHVEMTPSVSTELSSVSAPGTASLLPKVVTVRPVVLRKPSNIKINTGPTKQSLLEAIGRLTNRVVKLTQKCKAQKKLILKLKKYRRQNI